MFSSSDPGPGPIAVIGAGPAGLTAAYELSRRGARALVLDEGDQVGGLARTATYKGFHFDIGGHRFFTKLKVVDDLWHDMLGSEFLTRPRLSRIYWHGRFFDYPLRAANVLRTLGLSTSASVLGSYFWSKLFPIRPEVSFKDWVSNRFGRKLFRIFFESYTEKVWGIPCETITAQWAAQRIRGLSLPGMIVGMLGGRGRSQEPRTLVREFKYPRLGPGMMWEAFRSQIESAGSEVRLGARVVQVRHDGARIRELVVEKNGVQTVEPAGHVISTMAIRDLVGALAPAPPPDVLEAAAQLTYRDFIVVAVILDQAEVFPDNWLYIHDPAVRVGRIQNFKNWSGNMVSDPRQTCLGLEYFCSEGDTIWSRSDAELLALARQELSLIGLADVRRVVDGTVLRVRKAYPVYAQGYREALDVLRGYLGGFENLQLVGRNGMHRYNNQDHSMFAAMLAVRNLFGEAHDLWAINTDDEYHESAGFGNDLSRLNQTQPRVPMAAAKRAE